MNIHEYQAKELLAKFGVPVPAGHAALSVEEAVEAAKQLPGPLYVVKAQIHAGGRGKGKFKELGPDAKGGVRLAKTLDEVRANAADMLGNTLVTIQTGPKQASRSTASTLPMALISKRNSTSRCSSIARQAASPWSLQRKAA
jgi:succinyl-CoA synthetase beta subunit